MKKKLLAGLALGVMMLGIGGVASATSLTPTQDTLITNNDNAGSIFNYLTVNWADGWKNVGLVQFDTSSLVAGSFSSATLNLYHQYNDGNGANFGIFANTSGWDENTTWDTAPTYNPLAYANLTIDDHAQDLWRSVDITSLVAGWANGSITNYGLRIERLDQENPYVYFQSQENSNVPYLDVNSSAPVPEPATMLLFGTGLASLVGARLRRKK